MLDRLTDQLVARESLSRDDIAAACERLLDENEPFDSRAAFLRALHQKGETPAEIAAFVEVLLARANRPSVSSDGILDLCGTGGDRLGLFNISTATMFVVAAADVRVVKHGNRGITSKSGGADVLEALGVSIDLPPDRVGAILDQAGCYFLFAPHYHPAFKAVVPVRKALAAEGTPTIFNILGPLLNPACPDFQIAGVFNEKFLPVYAETFRLLGRKRAWAVHGTIGDLGLDEVSSLGPTRVLAYEGAEILYDEIHPAALGITGGSIDALKGGTAAENAALILSIFQGENAGPARDIILINSAAALVVAGAAPDIQSAFALATETLESKKPLDVLERLRQAN